jgi:hypothetical protein
MANDDQNSEATLAHIISPFVAGVKGRQGTDLRSDSLLPQEVDHRVRNVLLD